MSSSIFRRFSSSARLGDLLVQAGILTPAQLSDVVKNSRTKKLQIGQVLVMSNLLTPKDLQIVLEAQSMLRDKTIDLNLAVQCIKVARKIGANFSDVLEDYDQSAAQRARTGKLGELFSDAGVISQEDLSEAMERSVNTGMPLGRMLVLNKTISSEVLQKGLDVQLRLRDELITREEALLELRRAAGMSDEIADTPAPVEEKKQPIVRLGELLVMAGILNETDVMDALEWGLANQQPIGNVLVSQELISKELLDAALFFQQATRDGKIDSMKACECLSEVFSTGVSPEEALAEAEPTKPREELKVAPITYQQLVTMSRVVTEEDIERAFDQERHSAAFIGKVLVLTGIMDVPTLQSTLRCYQMVAKGWLTVDDAIAALDYCLHQNPTAPLSFEQALRDLQWTMETGLTMRGERATVSSTKLDAIRPTKKTPPPEPVEEEAPAAPSDEDEEEAVAEEAAEPEEEAAEQPEEAEKEESKEESEEEKEEAPAAPEEEEEQEEPAESSSKDEEKESPTKNEMPLDEEFATEEEELAPAAPEEDEEESEELEQAEEPEVNEEEAAESTAEEEEEESEEIKVKEAELVAAKREAEPVAAKSESKGESKPKSKGESESPKSESKGAGKGPINSESDDDDDEPSLSDALRGLYDEEPEQGKDNGAQKEEEAEVTEPDDRSSSTGGLKALLKGLASNPDEESPEEEPSKAEEKSEAEDLKSIKEEALSKAEKAATAAKAEKEEAAAKAEKEEAAAKAKEEATAKSAKVEPAAKAAPKSDMAAKIREQAEALAKVDTKKDEKEKAEKAESKKEPAEKDDSKEGKTKSAKVQKELAEIEDIAGMSAEQLLAQIMKTATNPEAAAQVAKRGGRFSETILPEDAKARQLAKLVGNQASKELTERLSFEKQDENAEALDTAFARLAETYFEQGNYKEAQVIYERMLVHRLNDLGPDNPLLVEDYNNLAMTLCVQGRFDKAEPFMKRAVHLYESEPNRDAVEHADYLHSLGTILYKLEKFKDAEEVMLKVVQLRKDGLPEDHEDMGRALADYAKVLKKLGKADVADSIYKKAREILAKNS